jgi:putative salt-induced outer membrane protein
LFGQSSLLSDRFNSYDSRSILTGGYDHQILNGPVNDLRVEFGPVVHHDEYHGGERSTKELAYGAANYSYQLTNSTKITPWYCCCSDKRSYHIERGSRH